MDLRKRFVGGIALATLAAGTTGCPGQSGTGLPTSTTVPGTARVLAIGDSNAGNSTDPLRGLPWSARLGSDSRNGSNDGHGQGWKALGTYTGGNFAYNLLRENVLSPGSQVVVVEGGVNDLGIPVQDMLEGLSDFVNVAKANGQHVVLMSMFPTRAGSSLQWYESDRVAFNSQISTLFAPEDVTVVDCNGGITLPNGKLDPAMSIDDKHLNSVGEQAIADCVVGVIPPAPVSLAH